MQYITTTQLRTKSSQLVDVLKKGGSVSLIHRSNIIGTIKSAKFTQAPPATEERLREFVKALKPKKLIPRSKREEVYRRRLMEKYGKSLS